MTKAEGKLRFDTRTAHTVLMDGLDAIEASLEVATLERQVEIGSVLWELGDRVLGVLSKIKEALREEALRRSDGQVGMVLVEGDDFGEASVTIPEATLRVPKGINTDDLKRVLGSDFGLFFEEVVTVRPRKEFEERATAVKNALHQHVLHSSVQRVEGTPRVSFRRHKPPKKTNDTPEE